MPDTTNGSLDAADPPETHPPGTTTELDSGSDLEEAQVAADPPETHPPTT